MNALPVDERTYSIKLQLKFMRMTGSRTQVLPVLTPDVSARVQALLAATEREARRDLIKDTNE